MTVLYYPLYIRTRGAPRSRTPSRAALGVPARGKARAARGLLGDPRFEPARRPRYPAPVRLQRSRQYGTAGALGVSDPRLQWPGRRLAGPGGLRAEHVERLDAMFASGECPPAVVVFVDAWTSLGGSQFVNSSVTGRYMDYLCDEVVDFVDARYPTLRGATTVDSRASPRAAMAPWSCRCPAPTSSARSLRTPATRCSSAATCPSFRWSRARYATTSRAPTGCSWSAYARPTTSIGRSGCAVQRVRHGRGLLA